MSGNDRTNQEQSKAAAAPDEAVFLQHARKNLDRSCAVLDGTTQSRLNTMRHAALAHGQHRGSGLWSRMPQLLPFGGLVTACALVVAMLVQMPSLPGSGDLPATAQVEDLDLLVATEDLDFYEEFEFYQWLATSDAGY